MGEHIDEAKGRMKEAAGKLADDPELEKQGKQDRAAGKLKGAVEAGKDKVEEWIDNGKDKMRRE